MNRIVCTLSIAQHVESKNQIGGSWCAACLRLVSRRHSNEFDWRPQFTVRQEVYVGFLECPSQSFKPVQSRGLCNHKNNRPKGAVFILV